MYPVSTQRLVNEPFAWSDNVFSKDELDLIIKMGKELSLIEASVNNSGIPKFDTRRSKIGWFQPNVSTDFIFSRVRDAINRLNAQFYQYTLTEMEDIQFSEYDESYNGMYRNHTDDGFEGYGRKLSFSLQLSDEEDYDGGDLLIYRFKLTDGLQVPKTQGLLTIFPSWTIHEVTSVTKGTRHSLVGWVHGPNFR